MAKVPAGGEAPAEPRRPQGRRPPKAMFIASGGRRAKARLGSAGASPSRIVALPARGHLCVILDVRFFNRGLHSSKIIVRTETPRLQKQPGRNLRCSLTFRILRSNSQNSGMPTTELPASCRSVFAFLPNMISSLSGVTPERSCHQNLFGHERKIDDRSCSLEQDPLRTINQGAVSGRSVKSVGCKS